MRKGTILVIGSSATQVETVGGGTVTVGQFLNETAVPLMTLVAAGYDFVLATPTGEKPHMDKDSDGPSPQVQVHGRFEQATDLR